MFHFHIKTIKFSNPGIYWLNKYIPIWDYIFDINDTYKNIVSPITERTVDFAFQTLKIGVRLTDDGSENLI